MNYYQVLEIEQTASEEVIKAAYKALVKKYHPDNCSGDKTIANKKIIEINEAFAVLSDKKRREKYDVDLQFYASKQNEETKEKESEYSPEYEKSEGDEEIFSSGYEQEAESVNLFSSSRLGRFLKDVKDEIVDNIQKNHQEVQNAYFDGMNMPDTLLIHRFKKARGNKRLGYIKAMESKGLVERDEEGKIVPTAKYRLYE